MKPFQVSGPASVELAEAARRYEVRRSGLGVDFFDEVTRAIELIRTHPEIGTSRAGRVSRTGRSE